MAKIPILNADDISKLVWKNNVKQIFTGFVCGLVALIFWPISYWGFYGLFHLVLVFLGIGMAQAISICLAFLGVLFLAVEGYRYYQDGTDNQAAMKSEHAREMMAMTCGDRNRNQYETGFSGTSLSIDPAAFAGQVVFIAPRMSISAVKAFRSYIHTTVNAIQEAARVYDKLAMNADWMPASALPDYEAGVILLDRLELIWKETMEGEMHFRIMPGRLCK